MKLSEELIWRGLANQSTLDDITRLDEGSRKFYWGVDPSADSMTIGNLASAMLVKHFINHGHEAVLLVGGATGLIGDPDGKKDERNLKTRDVINSNKAAIVEQYKQIFAGQDFEIVDNHDWFKDINFIEFLMTVGKNVPTAQMISRGFVQSRLETTGISFAEFSYSLIQAYDFLHLFREKGVTLQLCGSDQWGNSTAGASLIRRMDGQEAHVFTTPLVVNKATGKKFGKTENGAIWLDENKTSVFEFFQFWLNTADDSVIDFLKIFTLLPREEIEALEKEVADAPFKRAAQKALAFEVTKLVHGEAKANTVRDVTNVLFGKKAFTELDEQGVAALGHEIGVVASGNVLTKTLVDAELASSLSDARRLIKDGGISINGLKAVGDVTLEGTVLLKRGKNRFVLVEKGNL
jgi:tyrosyl-tRNA synthetase